MSIPERSIAVERLYDELRRTLPGEKLVVDPLRRLAYGTDASFYRLVPQLVAIVDDENELTTVVRACHRRGIPFTFRAAGTSLSGQSITDSVLIKLGSGWRGHRLGYGAETISLQPGIIGAHANRILAPYHRKIGPDPASINAAMIGGIAANNASGMCCGTAQNSYQTLVSMRVVLADGTRLDTGDAASREAFRASHGVLLDGLARLAREVRDDATLAERIRHKFKIKNTTGYSLNALVDFDDPFEILQHLMIGSEGTLGFIAEITYRTVPDHPDRASALVFFPDIETACDAVTALKPTPVSAVELIDRAGLHSVEDRPGLHIDLKGLGPEVTALLIEVRGTDAAERDAHRDAVEEVLAGFATVRPVAFTARPDEYAELWDIRKGMFPAVGAVRETGTTVIIEDVAFPIAQLSAAVRDLQTLFAKYHYDEAILFGHALEGNLHFVFTQDFGSGSEVARYAGLMDEVAELVVGRYDGSLKAEHGTGRNMAPFVEMEWGRDAYALMERIKALFDPEGLLNPGVILNANRHVHLENLKPLPAADPIVDTCIECGFCEPHCPSRELTLTPRQRITAWREIARLGREAPGDPLREILTEAYRYQGTDTCAADGLCSIACPVGIDTGDLTRALRHREGREYAGRARWIGEHFAGVTGLARLGLRAASAARAVTGDAALGAVTRGLRGASGGRVPEWHRWMPGATTWPWPRPEPVGDRPRVIYLPSCGSRTMGAALADRGAPSLPETVYSLLGKAGYDVVLPEGLDGLCCGMAFQSKGQFAEARRKGRELLEALLEVTRGGHDPVLFDTSPCLLHMQEQFADRVAMYEPVEFVERYVLPAVDLEPVTGTVAVHVTCSGRKLGLAERTVALAEMCAEEVVVPEHVGCCGFAGDRGFEVPELNAAALRHLPAGLDGARVGYSTSRTCEIGLSRHGDIPYRSILELVDRAARAPE
ncbi:MAG: FAD-binding and (Fe-S)-binding domain-containing protein [Gammaproteobacteria bacterium]|nr:FAD-binding and (Fe-S)-binding domain-containing protein [Gammaproteobacteria bacterium]